MARVNRAIELLAAGQPVYYTGVDALGYRRGVEEAKTWADCLILDLEHIRSRPRRCTTSCAGWSTAGRREAATVRPP